MIGNHSKIIPFLRGSLSSVFQFYFPLNAMGVLLKTTILTRSWKLTKMKNRWYDASKFSFFSFFSSFSFLGDPPKLSKSRIQDPGSRIQDPGSRIQDPGPRTHCPGARKTRLNSEQHEMFPAKKRRAKTNLRVAFHGEHLVLFRIYASFPCVICLSFFDRQITHGKLA